MILSVIAGYLWLPVKRTNPVVKLHFHAEGRKFQEIDIPLGYDYAEYYAPMDLLLFIGPKPGSNLQMSSIFLHEGVRTETWTRYPSLPVKPTA